MIQTQFINYIIETKDTSLITLNNLNVKYFSDYGTEWKFIENHIRDYGCPPDKETFINVFPDFEIINVKEPPSYLITELCKDYQTRQLASAFTDVRKELMSGNTEAAVNIYKKIEETLTTGVAIRSIDLIHDTSRFNVYEEKTKNYDKFYVSTGFEELDNILGGWDRTEDLATIIARSGQGKTWVLIKCAEAAAKRGLTVGLYSGEMSEDKVGYRFDTLAGHISNRGLTHGNASVFSEYKDYLKSLPEKYKGTIKVLTPASINGPAGVRALRAFIEKDKLDILMVDQHSLLEDDRGATNPVEKAANISKDLKNLQVLKKIPIIAVSQMNRTKNEDNSELIDLAQISQSDRIGQDSTVVIGVTRDKKDESLFRLQVVKARDGGSKKPLSYIVDLDTGTFIFVPEENIETKSSKDEEPSSDECIESYYGEDNS